jgi:hypothetical protein
MKSREFYLDLIKNEPYKIGIAYGYDRLTLLHNEWIKKFMYSNEDYLLQAHRGSYKTTCLIIALGLLMIVRPNMTMAIFRKTDVDVVEVIKGVEKFLDSKVARIIIQAIWGVELKITSNQSQILTNLMTHNKGVAQLRGMGCSGSITGKHVDRLFTDDIINIKDRTSEAERKRIKAVYQELRNIVNRGGIIGNTGTPWHKDDAFALMPKPEIYTCYETGLISKDELKKIRQAMTPSLFAANYELKHIADENALFTSPEYTSDESSIYNGICHIDAGYGGEDFTAFTIMRKEGDNIVAFGKLWGKHIDDCLEEIFILREKYRAGTINVEHNGDKGYLSKELYKIAEQYNKNGLISSPFVDVNCYHEAMNKDVKIKTYLYTNWRKIKWLEDTDSEYMNQILDYTEDASHDDAPDSASSALRRLINGGKVQAISSLWD